jgi:hypothetical protein
MAGLHGCGENDSGSREQPRRLCSRLLSSFVLSSRSRPFPRPPDTRHHSQRNEVLLHGSIAALLCSNSRALDPQIWELSSGGGAKLNQIQFSSAMRLVALAQAGVQSTWLVTYCGHGLVACVWRVRVVHRGCSAAATRLCPLVSAPQAPATAAAPTALQASGGQLPLEQARAIVAGVGPSLPPPRLQGLEVASAPAPAAVRTRSRTLSTHAAPCQAHIDS